MRTSRVSALLLLIALAFVCFVSAPVLSGEHPWDADDTGTDGADSDTLLVVTSTDTATTNSMAPGSSGDDIGGLIGQLLSLMTSVSLLH
jgi:hypothetical protein